MQRMKVPKGVLKNPGRAMAKLEIQHPTPYCSGKDVPGGGQTAQCLGFRFKPFSHPELGENMSIEEPETKGRGQ